MKNLKKKLINFRLLLLRNGISRGEYLKKKKIFKEFGNNVWWQPYKIPPLPNMVKIGNNVKIATEVLFIEHDIIDDMFNNEYSGGVKNLKSSNYKGYIGTIEIGDNVFIGARSIIMYNVKIGSNCIIGAGSVVTKNIPSGSVVAGVPAKIIGTYDNVKEKYKKYSEKYKNYNLYDDAVLEKIFWIK